MTPKITEAEFAFLVRRAGLTLTEPQKAELYQAYGHLEAIAESLRRPRERAAEPAFIFAFDRDSAP